MWNNPHSLEELNGIIWRVAINITSQELCCMSRNIFGMCEAYLKVGGWCFDTLPWNKGIWTTGEKRRVNSRQMLCWGQWLVKHSVFVHSFVIIFCTSSSSWPLDNIIGLCVGHMLVIFNVDIFKGIVFLCMYDICLYYFFLNFTSFACYIEVLSYDSLLYSGGWVPLFHNDMLPLSSGLEEVKSGNGRLHRTCHIR
jgi:hypothetical protein